CLKEEYRRYVGEGKEIVAQRLRKLKLDPNTHEIVNQMRAYFDAKTPQEFLYKVGKGIISRTDIKRFKNEKVRRAGDNKKEFNDAKSFEVEIKKVRGVDSDMLLIGEDMDKIDYELAKCCNPIPGDDVFGFVTVNEGIKIHRTTCPNAVGLMSNYGYRIIKAKWTSQKELAFLAGLKLTGIDRVGLVSDVTRIISTELKVNMRSIKIETNDGIFEGTIMLFVNDTEHLDTLMKKLGRVPGIVNVTRFDN
nr:RelA/SpoT family protein [Cytophagales bacterium]